MVYLIIRDEEAEEEEEEEEEEEVDELPEVDRVVDRPRPPLVKARRVFYYEE